MHQDTGGRVRIGLIRLSSLIADPVTRDAFERAERDHGNAFAVPVRRLAIVVERASTRDRRALPLRKRLDLPTAIIVVLFTASMLAGALLHSLLP
jgi:hypothetical protein